MVTMQKSTIYGDVPSQAQQHTLLITQHCLWASPACYNTILIEAPAQPSPRLRRTLLLAFTFTFTIPSTEEVRCWEHPGQ